MENKSDNRFDYFIKAKMESASSIKEDQWNRMETALNKRDFFRFSLTRFNIVYLLLLLIGLSILLYLLVPNSDESSQNNDEQIRNEESKFNENIIDDSAKTKLKHNMTSEEYNVNEGVKISSNTNNTIVEKESKKLEVEEVTSITGKVDSIISAVVKPDTVIKPLIVKKIRYVTRRDTIIQVDTSRQRKKR